MAKRLKYLVEKENGDIIIKDVRLSYLFCHEPQSNVNDDGDVTKKYKVTGILPTDTHQAEIDWLRDKAKSLAKEAFKQNIAADRYCIRDGALTAKDEYEGAWIFVASEREDNPPACLDRDGKTKVKKSDDKLYSGAKGNIMVRFWTQDNKKGGKRVNANFLGVQFLEHGDKFSSVSRPKDDEMFDDEGGGTEGAGFDDDDADGL